MERAAAAAAAAACGCAHSQVLLSGTFIDAASLDLPKWAVWLADNGYSNKAGWDTLMEGIKVGWARLNAAAVGQGRGCRVVLCPAQIVCCDRVLQALLPQAVSRDYCVLLGVCQLCPASFAVHGSCGRRWDTKFVGLATVLLLVCAGKCEQP